MREMTKPQFSSRIIVVAAIALASVFGCASKDTRQTENISATSRALSATDPQLFVLRDDGLFTRRGKLFQGYTLDENLRSHSPKVEPTTKEIEELDDEEIRDRFRTTTLAVIDGQPLVEYVEERDSVDVAVIRKARAEQIAGVRYRGDKNIPGRLNKVLEEAPNQTPFEHAPILSDPTKYTPGLNVWAPDDRYFQPAGSYVYPNDTAVSLYNGTLGGGCSATMVGWYTAISAAHCFFNTQRSTAPCYLTYCPMDYYWSTGLVQTQMVQPGGARTVTMLYPPYGQGHNNFYLSLPPQWTTGLPNPSTAYDFALLEFWQYWGFRPGYPNHYAFVGVGGNSDYVGGASQMTAYDGNVPSWPTPPPGPPYYVWQTMLWRSEPAGQLWVPSGTTDLLYTYLDITAAASGGGALNQIFKNVGDPTYYWAGDYIGAFDATTPNFINRMTTTKWSWVQSVSTEF